MSLTWHFPTTGGGEDDGLHDSLRENFEGDHERFVARETIQNSSDAKENGVETVQVSFERFNLPTEYILEYKKFTEILYKAKNYTKGQEGSEDFFNSAIKMIESTEISVLKISDYNTTGLRGSDENRDGEWYRLIKATGASSMSGTGGGSFGIGKGAPFAASALRMVFYSTVTKSGEQVFQGKSRITSFIDNDDDKKRGTGFLGIMLENDKAGVSSVRSKNEIPEVFRRSEQGTDIYIIGYLTDEDDWRKLLIQSVLANFWAAIHYSELIVSFSDDQSEKEEINNDNLEEYLSNYSEGEKDDPLYFYKALIEGEKIEEHLPLLGECSMFIKKNDGYPKMVQLMRKSKMVIETKPPSAFRVLPEPYAAVFICKSNKGNKLLRKLEPPAHDKWDPNREKKLGKKIVSEFQDFIRTSLRSLAQQNNTDPEEIPELSYFLPEDEEIETGIGSNLPQPDNQPHTEESGSETGAEKPTEPTGVNPIVRRPTPVIKKGNLGGGKKRVKNGGKGGKGKGGSAEQGNGNRNYIDSSLVRFRSREIHENGRLLHKIILTPSADQKGKLRIIAVGEDGDYSLDIKAVKDSEGGKIEFQNSEIKNLNLKREEKTTIFLELISNKRYSLGIK